MRARSIERLRDRTGALDRGGGPASDRRVAAQRDAHAEAARELEQVRVVHAGQRQRIHAFHGEPVDDVVAHGTTLM